MKTDRSMSVPDGWTAGTVGDQMSGTPVFWRQSASGFVMVPVANFPAYQSMMARKDHEWKRKQDVRRVERGYGND